MALRAVDEFWATEDAPAPRISAIGVEGLFGRLQYRHEIPTDVEGNPAPLLLLYGDNGCGKTTLLNIVHHLLSPADNRGHRTALARIQFKAIDLSLSNGHVITARRKESLIGSFTVTVFDSAGGVVARREYKADETLTVRPDPWDMEHLQALADPESDRGAEMDRADDDYTRYLKSQRFVPLFLRDERQMDSDIWESDQGLRRRQLEATQPRVGPGVRALETALHGASNAIRDLSIVANAVGASGTNTIYLTVLEGLLSGGLSLEEAEPVRLSLQARIDELGKRNNLYAAHGFVPKLELLGFREIIERIPPDRVSIAQEVLLPFLTGLEKRLESLDPVYQVTSALVSSLNGFLTDKRAHYQPRTGLRVTSFNGDPLRPELLSSGERHLLTLLCSAVIARRRSTTFLIDEPEISLNVKWQRKLLPALMEITKGSSVQFLIASHSIEVLTPYQDSIFLMDGND